jgi:class 3 adenylate cyclase
VSAPKQAILIVDDNEDNRYTLRRRLTKEGFENLSEATNGEEALAFLGERPFDLVLLDIMMPVLDGYETLAKIKSDTRLRQIPIIMISALDEIDSVIRCIEAGAEDYLAKPFKPALLRARIHACLEKKRLRDQETDYLKRIEEERQRADELLHATLPAAAVHELKTTGEVRPRRFEGVTVLFTDIVGFTTYCDDLPPEKVAEHLQELVNAFEDIAAEHGLEKIKTIGDAIMLTAGLFQYVRDPVAAAIRCALAMIAAAPTLSAGWHVHAGLHSGPVVAGVIGRQQYLFDLWGDTVNIAARIVDQAAPDTVLASDYAWRQVGERGQGTSLGIVELKGKGGIELIECYSIT